MRSIIAALAVVVASVACGSAPDGIAADASVLAIDAPIDDARDAAAVDAAADDAVSADAPSTDAGVADAAAPDAISADAANPNPLGIALVDVSDQLPAAYPGGRTDPDPFGIGSSAVIGDVTGDGRPDLILLTCDAGGGGPSRLLRAGAGFSFTEDPLFSAAFAATCAHGGSLGDYDGDGDLDLFVAMHGSERLLDNDGGGGFTDVTGAAGMTGPSGDLIVGAVWADLNRDGLLDLYVQAHVPSYPPAPGPLNANRLYLNNGDKTFREVAAAAGAAGNGSTQAVAVADLDGDLDLELYLANDRFSIDGSSGVTTIDHDLWLDPTAYDGEGTPSYTDRSVAHGMNVSRSSMGIALADVDGNGYDDVYVTDWGRNHLQLWQPGGGYVEGSTSWGLAVGTNPAGHHNVSWGARFFDFDADGREELVIGNGAVREGTDCATVTQLNLILRRLDGGAGFVDATAAVGWPAMWTCPPEAGAPVSSRGVFVGDLDGDGDDDLVVAPYVETFRVYRNDTDTSGRHRLRVRPRGTVSAPDPAGAVLEVELAGGQILRRSLYAGGDTYGQSDRVVDIGLGTANTVARASLRWPSGYLQRLDLTAGFALDTELIVVEPAWLTVSTRVASAADPAPVLTYRPAEPNGAFSGAAGAGQAVLATRSDGVAVSFTDQGDGTYTAPLPHPGSARITVLSITVDGLPLHMRPSLSYR